MEKMNNERAKMELIDRVFSQKIVGKYTNLKLFSTNFAPIISTKRVIPHRRWLELVYAMPYLVLRREIFNSYKRTKNVFASAKQIWNILVHLDFPLSRSEYITTRLHRFSREKMKMQDTRFKMQVKPVSDILYPASFSGVNLAKSRGFYFESSSMELAQPVSHEITRKETESAFTNYPLPIVTQQLPVVSHTPSAISYKSRDIYSLSGTSDFIAPIFRFYSFKPTSFLSQKAVPVKPRGAAASQLQKSDTVLHPYGHLEREVLPNGQKIVSSFESSSMELAQPVSHEITRIETESAFTNYRLPIVTQQPPLVSHTPSAISYKNHDIYSLSGTSDFIAPIFRSYSFKPLSFLSQKAVPVKPRGAAASNLQKSDTVLHPYGHLEREVLPNGQKIFTSFESSSMALAQPVSHEITRKETESAFTNYPLPIVTQQLPVVSHTPSAISYKSRDIYSLSGTSDFIAPIFRSYSFKPTSFLSQKTVPNEHLQKSDTVLPPYGHLERVVLPNGQATFSSFESSSMALAQPVSHETTRKETESAFTNYRLPIVIQQPPVVSHTPSAISYKNRDIYSLSGTSDFIAPIFRSYSFKPTSFLSQKTVPNEHLQKSDTVLPPYGHLERVVLPNGQATFSSFESSSMALAQPVSHETTRKETESAFTNYRLPIVIQQPPVVSREQSAICYKNRDIYSLSGTSDFIAPIFRSYSFKPTSFLSQQTVPEKQRGATASNLQKGVTVLHPYRHLERAVLPNGQKIFSSFESSSMELAQPVSPETTRKETESAFTNYPLPIVTQQPPVVSHEPSAVNNKNLVTYIPSGTSDFINRSSFNIINKKNEQMQLGIKKTPIYHTYPKIEHVTSTHMEIIKERVIEKEDKASHATPQLPSIDLNRLTDQVYQMLERKVRIERERRGLLCR